MARKVVLLVGTKRGLFIGESSAKRGTWKFRGPLMGREPVFCATSDNRKGVTLYAGMNSWHFGPTVHISKNGGKTWKRHETQPRYAKDAGRSVEQLWKIQPGNADEPGVLYCGVAPAGLFRSEDNGKSWNEVGPLNNHSTREKWQPGGGGLCLHSILINPQDSHHIVTGISAVGVMETTDAGKTWSVANLGLNNAFHPEAKGNEIGSCVHGLAFAAGGTGRVYMQNHIGVFRRDNVSSEWQTIENGLPSKFGFPIVSHPRDSETAYTIPLEADSHRAPKDGKLAVYRTRTGGKKWEKLNKGLPQNAFVGILRAAFATDGLEEAGLYFGTTSGQVYASNDEGHSWTQAADLLPPVNSVHAYVQD